MNFDDCFPFGAASLYLIQCLIYLIQAEYSINRSFQRMILVKKAGYLFQLIPILMYKEEIIGLVLCRRHFIVLPSGQLKKYFLNKRHSASFCEPAIGQSF